MVDNFESTMTGLLVEAQELCSEFLEEEFPFRYEHSQAVGIKACDIADSLGYPREFCIEMRILGILHDIGYSPDLFLTGHHAYDGGAFLCGHTLLADFAPDVAWHSTAQYEGDARMLEAPDIPKPALNRHRILWIADFTTSATGEPISLEQRLDGIRSRYDEHSPVIEALDASMDDLKVAAEFCGIRFDQVVIPSNS